MVLVNERTIHCKPSLIPRCELASGEKSSAIIPHALATAQKAKHYRTKLEFAVFWLLNCWEANVIFMLLLPVYFQDATVFVAIKSSERLNIKGLRINRRKASMYSTFVATYAYTHQNPCLVSDTSKLPSVIVLIVACVLFS